SIEGSNFSSSDYLKAVEVDKYIGFFILSSTWFTQEAAALASELRRVGKQFYFIRTKIDLNAPDYKNEKFTEDILRVVTADHFANLDMEYATARFFCVSCHHADRFDFLECVQALQRNSSPPLQKHALLLS
ncbi:hypothetical protein KFY57_26915, partial [Salmonella enterica subsp. enterica serovar Typhimurium]|nr:hypothetical protein [Salmonella enterica subsp. enterica serovar Typhimurium]